MQDLLLRTATKLIQIKLVRYLLNGPIWIYKKYQGVIGKRDKKRFDRLGLEMLAAFNKCLSDNGYKYSLAYGTLLGAVREKGFIKHDDDADVWMWIDDYDENLIDCLRDYGFKHKYSFSLDNDRSAKEDTFEYKGVLIDIFYLYKQDEKLAYSCIFNCFPGTVSRSDSVKRYGGLQTIKCILPVSRDVVFVPFESLTLPIPANAPEILKCRYGDDYLVPQPNWNKNRKDTYHVLWEGKVSVYKEF